MCLYCHDEASLVRWLATREGEFERLKRRHDREQMAADRNYHRAREFTLVTSAAYFAAVLVHQFLYPLPEWFPWAWLAVLVYGLARMTVLHYRRMALLKRHLAEWRAYRQRMQQCESASLSA